jgi:FtsP/CotA-like multicopper oxidase with cupredoxin domain
MRPTHALIGWGSAVPTVSRWRITLIGSDAGLLSAPLRCDEAFLATAERIDILVDLRDAAVGDTVLLETRAFDPMHMEMTAPVAAVDHAATGHAAPPATDTRTGAAMDHAAMGHGGSLAEGVPRTLLQLRVRERIPYGATIPQRLSSIVAIDTTRATERPLRLGFAKGRWRINDRVFAMGETPIEVKRDTIETWLIRNYFTSMPHAMHLHGFHFPGAGTANQSRANRGAEGGRSRTAGDGYRVEGHGDGLAGREREDRDRL